MSVLFLSDNSYTFKREEIRDDNGALPDPLLTATCLLSATEGGAKIGTLELTGIAISTGTLRAILSGTALSTQLESLMAAAETAKRQLYIYDRVIVAGVYSDNELVHVRRHRPAGIPAP